LKAIAMTSPTAPGIDVPDDGGVFRNSAYRWSLYVTNAIDEKTYNDDAPWRELDQAWYTSGKPYRDLGSLYGHARPVRAALVEPSQLRSVLAEHDSVRTRAGESRYSRVDHNGVLRRAGEGGALYYFKEQHRYDRTPITRCSSVLTTTA
jgi:hypothetical protein